MFDIKQVAENIKVKLVPGFFDLTVGNLSLDILPDGIGLA